MTSQEADDEEITYQTGFGNEFQTEAIPGALPQGQNNPLRCPLDLHAEQISGTAFTKQPRSSNLRTWLYRIRPSVSGYEQPQHSESVKSRRPYVPYSKGASSWFGQCGGTATTDESTVPRLIVDPNPMRWKPMPPLLPPKHDEAQYAPAAGSLTFVDGVRTMAMSGDVSTKSGLAVHMYSFQHDMSSQRMSMYNADGDFLFVPQQGGLRIQTEMGFLNVPVGDIVVIPRGIVFSVNVLPEKINDKDNQEHKEDKKTGCQTRGYILEIFKGHFDLPNLGPIGANGLANPRDFHYPVAAFDPCPKNKGDDKGGTINSYSVVTKFCHRLFVRQQTHSPYNVVAWHGNYAPFQYSLRRFCCMNSVTYDHPDPSIYTVLTAISDEAGTALADFVIFPPRWMVMEKTFRPPYFHRNVMCEFMGMVYGSYDAKKGFLPGGASLHNCMTPHGPDRGTVEKETRRWEEGEEGDGPVKFEGGLAFMFETCCALQLTEYAVQAEHLEEGYAQCWEGIPFQWPNVGGDASEA